MYYVSDVDGFEGLKHHINSFHKNKGAISVISFDDSILDFIPFRELTDKAPFRVLIPKYYAVTFDGDLRYFYTHGVPTGLKYKNNYRYALNIRHPYIKNKNKNCNLSDRFEFNENYKCMSSIIKKPLSYN